MGNRKVVIFSEAPEVGVFELDATYSPEDNKLRLYAAGRLDPDTYARVRRVGFRWAPKQELFACPRWTPEAEDVALELAGEIGDEDTSLTERAEERAERFGDYQSKRAREADAAADAVDQLAQGIPLGQPILVGHHSEKHARRDAERIERGMRKAVKLWDTSRYWEARARGVIRNADYKDRAPVRARRIKGLEAERRKWERSFTPDPKAGRVLQTPWGSDSDERVPHVWVGARGRGGHWAPESSLPAAKARAERWLAHLDRRLTYERTILEAQGGSHLLEKPKRPKAPPLLNFPAKLLQSRNEYYPDELIGYAQVGVMKDELRRVPSDYKGTRLSLDGSFRFRIAHARSLGLEADGRTWDYVAVYLTDSKAHPVPDAPGIERYEVKP